MNYKMMGRFVAQILTIGAAFMLPALMISLHYKEDRAVYGFLITLGIFAVVIGLLRLICRSAPSAFYAREGLVCVGVSWIVLSVLSCLPFYFSREIPKFIDAFSKMVSAMANRASAVWGIPD